MTFRILGALTLCLCAAACSAGLGPDTVSTRSPAVAPSGITSSNGGGQRQLGNIPSIGVTTNGSPAVSGVPNSRGNSY